MNTYLLFKSLHLIAVISWMAGLLYLPRIFVYHVEKKKKKKLLIFLKLWRESLYNYIMRPAMILTWVFGLILIYLIGFETFFNLWLQIKLILSNFTCQFIMNYLGKCLVSSFKNETNTRSSKFFRIINEIPTVIVNYCCFCCYF